MIRTDDLVVDLSEDAAWTFLGDHALGRLAYHLVGEVHIVPVNYLLDRGRLLFRTAPGSKLLGVVMHQDVAFEVDEVDRERAVSVVARGQAQLLTDREADAARELPLRSWVATDKDEVVAVEITEISGREFRLDRS